VGSFNPEDTARAFEGGAKNWALVSRIDGGPRGSMSDPLIKRFGANEIRGRLCLCYRPCFAALLVGDWEEIGVFFGVKAMAGPIVPKTAACSNARRSPVT
jgi:hypothetical protein